MDKTPTYNPRKLVYDDEPSNEDVKTFVKGMLSTNDAWAKKALLKIYEYQTKEEQEVKITKTQNGIGFSALDAHILTSFAQQLINKNYLTPKQMNLVFQKIPKYWKQIIMISDIKKLKKQVSEKLQDKSN